MRHLTVAVILLGLLLMMACSNPADDKSKAVTREAIFRNITITFAGREVLDNAAKLQDRVRCFQGDGSHNGSFKDFSGRS